MNTDEHGFLTQRRKGTQEYPKGISSLSPALPAAIGLRWVVNRKMTPTVGVGKYFFGGAVDPGWRVPRNPGLMDEIPLGFGEVVAQLRREAQKISKKSLDVFYSRRPIRHCSVDKKIWWR
jgi:hypothetical protein